MNIPKLYAIAEKLNRKARISSTGEITWLDGPAPSSEAWAAAETAVETRKTITAVQFAALFTVSEKHEIFRRASLSANSSPTAPAFAALHFRFAQLESVRSDSVELEQTLDLLEQTGVINDARRARIAAFLPPAN